LKFLIPPWKHQVEAIERAALHPNAPSDFALFFEMGTGKTGTLINILRARFNEKQKIMRTLILCPPIVIKNWKEEWKKHSTIDPCHIILLTGSGEKRARTFMEEGYTRDTHAPQGKIFVTNYEALLMDALFEQILAWKPEVLVLDESHKCKDAKSKRTKKAIQLSTLAKHRYLLSGTPVLNSPLDLFSQFVILDQGATFGKNFFAFRGRYFRDRNAGMPRDRYFPKWEVVPGALEDINQKIFVKGMRVEKKDCIDLPPMVYQTIKVPMEGEQARLYKEMKKDLITFLKDKAVTATMAMTKAMRLMQIASGYAKTAEGEEISLGQTPKQVALKELLEELTPNHKVLVWAVWKENYAQIRQVCEELGVGYTEVHGDIPSGQKFANVDRFNTDSKCRVLIGHPGSGGIGINLVVASYSIFYSRNFSLEQSLQAEARNYRGGSLEAGHEKITRIDLVCEGTIDELVSEKLAMKEEIGEKLLSDLSLELAKLESGV
jgi:SNF2 family DNA or RNA helicase